MKALLFASAMAMASVSPLSATTVIPLGVQTNVSVSTVLDDWGWTISYQGAYSGNVSISTMFAGIDADDYVMFAARPVGSTTFTLLAAALFKDVTTFTDVDETTTANGAEWYYNSFSMGFAGLGSTIYQSPGDATGVFTDPENDHLRLSWHTSGTSSMVGDVEIPTEVNAGWRAGENVNLNLSDDWERLVLVAKVSPIPEPGSVFAIGLLLSSGCLLRLRGHSTRTA